MADVPETPKIVPGTPVYSKGEISFDKPFHPGMEAADQKADAVRQAIEAKLAATPDLKTKWDELEAQIVKDKLSADQAMKRFQAFTKQHLPDEHAAFTAAGNDLLKARKELHSAQAEALGKLKTIGGATEAEFAEAVKKFHQETKRELKVSNRLVNPGLFNTHFAVLNEEGIGAALKNNFSFEAMKSHPGKIALKGGGVAVGIGATLDATFRSQKTGPDGKPVDRSWGARILEGGAGLTLAAGSALHGGR